MIQVDVRRLASIDLVRGLVMVIMIDHTRDFINTAAFTPAPRTSPRRQRRSS
jgi:uncharacterized membrane protein